MLGLLMSRVPRRGSSRKSTRSTISMLVRSLRAGQHRLLKEAELNRLYVAAGLRSEEDED